MELLLRDARPAEHAQLSALALRAKAHWGYSGALMAAFRDELTLTRGALASGAVHYVVAEHDGTAIGFYGIEHRDDGSFEIDALFVAPEWIGNGIGRRLLEHAIDNAAERGGHRLVVQSDPHAEGFYTAMGATKVSERESGSVPGRYLPVLVIPVAGSAVRRPAKRAEQPT